MGTPYGPHQQIQLLRDLGWCHSSGFPSGSPCKYTSRGWQSWKEVYSNFTDEGFKMAYSSKVGSVMLVSKDPGSTTENHIQHNPVVVNPLTNTLLPWMEISGSPFSVSTGGSYPFLYYMDITNSCLGSYNADLVLSGGYTHHHCTRCSYATSQPNVAFWSVSGNSNNSGPPEFEQAVIPQMMTSREAHGCIEFEGMFLAVGGYSHSYSHGPNGGDPNESYTYHSSVEYYD